MRKFKIKSAPSMLGFIGLVILVFIYTYGKIQKKKLTHKYENNCLLTFSYYLKFLQP